MVDCSTSNNISPVSQLEVQFLILTDWRSLIIYLLRGERWEVRGERWEVRSNYFSSPGEEITGPSHHPPSPLSPLSGWALSDQHRNINLTTQIESDRTDNFYIIHRLGIFCIKCLRPSHHSWKKLRIINLLVNFFKWKSVTFLSFTFWWAFSLSYV